jgi:photosystem II stability/assembly factor-like uncharacterized protein
MKKIISILFFFLLLSQPFHSQGQTNFDKNLSEQIPIQVTFETEGVHDFVWSPDGNQFAYIALVNNQPRLYRINIDGSNKFELSDSAYGQIDWKENVIVFKAIDPQAPPYYNVLLNKINPDGSGLSTIIGPYWYHGVYLRSDANWILYERAPYGNWQAMRCDMNGNNELQLNPYSLVQQVGWLGNNQVLYSRGTDYNTPCGIYKVNFDGSGYVPLTPEYLPNNATFIASPDTSKILYCNGSGNDWNICIMNADGSNKTQLTSDPARDYLSNTRDNIWSTDGQSFYFVSNRSGNGDIYRLNIDGSGLTKITSDDSLDFVPIPSPDGSKLAFISRRNGVQNIWLIQLGLVAYYPFTGNANDSSGNGHHGTTVNNPLLVNDRFGNATSAYYFNGIDQRIDLPSSIKITADLSISFWVQTAVVDNSSWPNARFIIDRDICGGARDWSIGLGLGGKIQFNTGTGGADQVLTSTSDVNDSAWHHIVVIRDSAGLNKKIFIDGFLNTSSAFYDQQFLNNSEQIFIAACVCDPFGHKYFPGAIDDIRIYNRPLTAEEIQQLYFEGGWPMPIGWIQQNSGTNISLFGVSFTDANTGTVVGQNGTILRTTNGGQNWISQSSGTNNNLHGVSFTNANIGTAVGELGIILRTTNGGQNWISQSSGTNFELSGVSFTDANNGTVVGQEYNNNDGIILRTTNGGQNWINQLSFPEVLLGVFFTDTNNGTAVGGVAGSGYEIILRTTDGGQNWIIQSDGTGITLLGVCFSDVNNGTAVGLLGTIRRTTNGGQNWFYQTSGTYNHLTGVSFTDANNGTAVGYNGTILRTTNGGQNWLTQVSGTNEWLFGVSFTNENNGTAVGFNGTILRTWNGGVPVELTSFTASVNKNNVTLNWTTATELNNQGFEIQRSQMSNVKSQNDWFKIGFVPGSGTTTEPRSYSFVDSDLRPGKYSYRLKQIDYDGTFEYSDVVTVEISFVTPVEFALEQNYPNPFNPITTIKYNLPFRTQVTLQVFNLLGEEVKTLVNDVKEAGSYEVEFNAGSLSSGIYFYKIEAGYFIEAKKMVVLK